MADMQRMEYAEVDEMISLLRISAEDVDETAEAMRAVAKILEGGALLGLGGEAFVDALNGKFVPALQRLSQKLREESQYCQTERDDMYEAEQQGRNLFS